MKCEYELVGAEESGFVIDSPEKADWAVEKVKERQAQRDLYIAAAEAKKREMEQKIAEETAKCDQDNGFLLAALDAYIDTVPAKETKTMRQLVLPSGKIVRKLAKLDYTYDDAALLAYLQENAPEYVESKPKAKWGEFKKALQISNGTVIRTDTGEVVEAVGVIEKPSTTEVA